MSHMANGQATTRPRASLVGGEEYAGIQNHTHAGLQPEHHGQLWSHDVGQQQAENDHTVKAGSPEQAVAQDGEPEIQEDREDPEQVLVLGEEFGHNSNEEQVGMLQILVHVAIDCGAGRVP